MFAIETDNLTKSFGPVTAVENLSLAITGGELFGLIGPDGAGKTTVLRMLAAIMNPSRGSARILGTDTVRGGETVKEQIGYMSQRFGLYPDLTVLENITFYADIFGVPKRGRGERIDELLSFSNLTPFGKRRAGNLSGGMKQKLGLACALIHTPRVLLLDEPTNGVDPMSRRDFWRILNRLLKEGVTIFVTTAYLDEADRCHRVGLLHRGRLLACDTPQGLRKLVKGKILEVQTTRETRRALHLLREELPGRSVGLYGERLHVLTEDPERGKEELTHLLQRKGFEVASIRQIEPSLEDIFVSLIQP